MHDFTPSPRYPSEQWAGYEHPLNPYRGAAAMDDWGGAHPGPEAWIAHTALLSSGMAEEFPLLFPTATDCLLWVRWFVLPTTEQERSTRKTMPVRGRAVALTGVARTLATRMTRRRTAPRPLYC